MANSKKLRLRLLRHVPGALPAAVELGYRQSGGRNCCPGQKAEDPDGWGDDEAPDKGTVGGRWVYLGYILQARKSPSRLARVVKIETRPEDAWQVHPWDGEGGCIHTYSPIPIECFVGWSAAIDAHTFQAVNDDCNVHRARERTEALTV